MWSSGSPLFYDMLLLPVSELCRSIHSNQVHSRSSPVVSWLYNMGIKWCKSTHGLFDFEKVTRIYHILWSVLIYLFIAPCVHLFLVRVCSCAFYFWLLWIVTLFIPHLVYLYMEQEHCDFPKIFMHRHIWGWSAESSRRTQVRILQSDNWRISVKLTPVHFHSCQVPYMSADTPPPPEESQIKTILRVLLCGWN